jgi:zinc protease
VKLSLFRLAAPLALAAALTGPASAADEPFRAHDFTLGNGMQVVVIPDPRAPVVTHQVWFRTGSADDPRDAGGIAHFFEHLMFRGTPTHPDGEFDAIISRNGGDNNANTSYDRTVYYERVAKDRLGLVMELDADRMTNLIVSDKTVPSERNVILEERNQRTDTQPSSLFWEQMSAALYLAHPYGNPVIGWRSEIEGLTLEEAQTFYKTHYGPNNAILVVAGDVTVAEVRGLAEKIYGPLPKRELPPRVRAKEPPPLAARRVAMTDPRVAVPTWARLYLAPSYTSATDAEAYALQVLAYVLGGSGDTSRLGLALVKRDKVASSASAWYDGDGIDDRSIGVYAVPADGKTVADVEAAMDVELAKMIAEGPTADELARAKSVLVANAIYARDSQEGMANYYGEGLALGLTIADLDAWPDRISAVTADQVKAVAVKYLTPPRSVTGTLEPAPKTDAAAVPAPAAPEQVTP